MPCRVQIVVFGPTCSLTARVRFAGRAPRCAHAPDTGDTARPSISQVTASSSPSRPRGRARPPGTLYRGGPGMWSWVAHRITGLLTFFFLFAHVLDTALVRVSPESYDRVIDIYKNPIVNVMEIGLDGAVLFH